MTMPIALGLVDPEGAEVELVSADASPAELRSGVFALEGARRTLEFTGVPRRPALSFLRGFSAPVRVVDDLGEDDLVTLLKHDRDSFNRWQALQNLATRLLLRSVSDDPLGERAGVRAGLYRRLRLGRRGRLERTHRPGFRGAGAQLCPAKPISRAKWR